MRKATVGDSCSRRAISVRVRSSPTSASVSRSASPLRSVRSVYCRVVVVIFLFAKHHPRKLKRNLDLMPGAVKTDAWDRQTRGPSDAWASESIEARAVVPEDLGLGLV